NIQSIDTIADHARATINLEDACVVSPDKGSQTTAQLLAKKLGVSCITFAKERHAPNKTRIIDTGDQVDAKTAIIIDDIIDTGNTALNVCKALHQNGFTQIYGYFVHPVLSDDCVSSVEHSYFDTLFVSNSIALEQESEKIKQFDISDLLAEKINQIVK
ncbi:MAG: ribose-phosphate diphosphokinase, partial [Candidatus Babeliales bacterium]|nr:ribose-phosphate diphosphokinase [Candidatus Babeliales bacterium]